ncbi:MAG: quinolinate synthase NadA [Actinomycetota bacterium]
MPAQGESSSAVSGHGVPAREAGTVCPGRLAGPSDPEMVERVRAARARLGSRVLILGHHYQRDEVIAFADARGDSYKLAKEAAAHPEAEFIIFCGVHFMAESADILTAAHQQVLLPDLEAGCSMADMAELPFVEECWETLGDWAPGTFTPLTYINSSADIKAFTGLAGGAVCTSANAGRAMKWAFDRTDKVLFMPDQHLGRNTAIALGVPAEECLVWNWALPDGELNAEAVRRAKVVLWKGHCSVHQQFTCAQIEDARRRRPGVVVAVHPECTREVVAAADFVGSTESIIRKVASAAPGSAFVVGTEFNLVNRLASEYPDRTVEYLASEICLCSTMYRIDLPHLCAVLEGLVEGRVINRIAVDEHTAKGARIALERMLEI